ncbi:MAG: choice-of-anchor J domain-containing protein [Prevotella sp.]|nr:choice-of-anchor J domain-containing protein [Prevotellaceae bacterium]MDY3935690.1 choice-of-anchor J domain-containing protein [Prevotella sp.]
MERKLRHYALGLTVLTAMAATAQTSIVYKQDFGTLEDFQKLTVIDANSDGNTFKWDDFNAEAICDRDNHKGANDWLILPKLQLEAGKKYTLSFNAHTSYGEPAETFKVFYGNAATAEALTTEVLANGSTKAYPTPDAFKVEFEVATTGEYYLGFQYNTAATPMSNSLNIDEILLTVAQQAANEDVPMPVTDVKFTYDYKTKQTKLTWKAPTQTVKGNPIDPATLTYSLRRVGDSNNFINDWQGTTYREVLTVDQLPAGNLLFGQALARYVVLANNSAGQSERAYSRYYVLGTPNTLPYAESFAEGSIKTFWGEEHNKRGRWAPIAAKNTFVQDNDRGLYGFTGAGENETSLGFSGLISLKNATNPVLLFYYRFVTDTNDTLQVQLSANGSEFKTLKELDVKSESLANKWNEVKISLKDYLASDFIQLAFLQKSGLFNSAVYIDNIQIYDEKTSDLALSLERLPASLRPSETRKVGVKVINYGLQAVKAADYTVSLYANGKAFYTQQGVDIAKGASQDLTFDVTVPVTIEADSVNVYAALTYAADEAAANDRTAAKRVRIYKSSFPAPQGLTATTDGATTLLTWQQPDALRTSSTQVTDGFEDAPSFTIHNFGDWQLEDRCGYNLYGIEGYDFPNAQRPQAFTVLDRNAAQPALSKMWTAYEGEKALASFASLSGAVDHWAISPLLATEAQTISFYAKAASKQYREKFEVRYSTTSSDVEAFTTVVGDVTTPASQNTWVKYEFNLPQGTRYFAIRGISEDAWALLVDNVTFIPDTLGRQDATLLGYNIYRDGEKVNAQPVTTMTYADKATDGTHEYVVTAVYDAGESLISNAVSAVTNGITDLNVTTKEGEERIYDLSGRRVKETARGVYIINGKKIVK